MPVSQEEISCYMCGAPFECRGCLASHIKAEAPYTYEMCCGLQYCTCDPHTCQEG